MKPLFILLMLLFSQVVFAKQHWAPRASYNFDDKIIGHNLYVGAVNYGDLSVIPNFNGLSTRIAFGDKGHKINFSLIEVSPFASYEIGLSYIKQKDSQRPKMSSSRSGFAFEANVRAVAVLFTLVAAPENIYLTVGVGF